MIKRALIFSCFAAIVVACGSSGDSQFGNNAGDDGGTGDNDGSIDPNGDDGGMMFNNTDGEVQTDTGLNACATDSQRAKQLPLDLLIMQDTTGSMNSLVAAGQSKFQAVRSSLISFVNDPASAGIGVGLQYFPLKVAGVPETCTTSAQCTAAGGECLVKACAEPGGLVGCHQGSQCSPFSCSTVGVCTNNHSLFCFTDGQNCGNDASGFPQGTCSFASNTTSSCSDGDSCVAAQYAAPAVAISLLPGAAPALVASLNARNVYGSTPTSAALQGVVDGAKAAAIANPTHTVVAVLATDGLPSECDTNVSHIAAIAAAALAGTPSIKTFVIGVFTTAEQSTAKPNLDQIAAAGGTTSAFVVTASGGASAAFLTALNTIRGTALPCEYTLPIPESGTPDYTKLNVQYTAGSGAASIIGYATSAAGCDPMTGGWYFDADPAMGGHPTKVIMCPATCTKLKADTTGKIDIVQGCSTQVVVK